MGLALVKDLREYRAAPNEEDIDTFQTGALAGSVFARSAAGSADATIRGDADLGNRRLTVAGRTRPMDEPTRTVLHRYLAQRRERRPDTVNPI